MLTLISGRLTLGREILACERDTRPEKQVWVTSIGGGVLGPAWKKNTGSLVTRLGLNQEGLRLPDVQ